MRFSLWFAFTHEYYYVGGRKFCFFLAVNLNSSSRELFCQDYLRYFSSRYLERHVQARARTCTLMINLCVANIDKYVYFLVAKFELATTALKSRGAA